MHFEPLPLEGSEFLLQGVILGKFEVSYIAHQSKIEFRVIGGLELTLVVVEHAIFDVVEFEGIGLNELSLA